MIRDVLELQKREIETLLDEPYIERTDLKIDLSNQINKWLKTQRKVTFYPAHPQKEHSPLDIILYLHEPFP